MHSVHGHTIRPYLYSKGFLFINRFYRKASVFVRSLVLFCLLALQAPLALAWHDVVDKVIDGDSLRIRHESGRVYDVRLYGVDAPELPQTNGHEARDAARKLVDGKAVEVQVINVDPNGTTIAVVSINDQYSLQAFLVGSGLAWVYDGHCDLKICNQWRSMQQQAKAANRGLWIDPHPVPPWKWREQSHATTKPVVKKRRTVQRKKTTVRKKAPADISAEMQND